MTEEKDMEVKLQPEAKEFIPKAKATGMVTREARSGSLSLNPAAKEFIPKTSPLIVPIPAPFVYVPPLPPEGSFLPQIIENKGQPKKELKLSNFILTCIRKARESLHHEVHVNV